MDKTEDTVVSPATPDRDTGPRIVDQGPALTPDDVADAVDAVQSTYGEAGTINGVAIVDGFGVRVIVERGALELHDGIGLKRRIRRFEKATHGLRRVVVANATGVISLDAVRWCTSLDVGLVLLGPDGTPQLGSVPRATGDARLRRIQARAPELPVGLDIGRSLIVDKVFGQARTLTVRLGAHDAASILLDLTEALGSARTIDECRVIEASAAGTYFQAWARRPECVPRFAARDQWRVPPHWKVYEGRHSILASGRGNKKAERPTNAVLSYIYKLAEVEAILACHAMALDPGLGLIHLDARGRQSFALDLIEPLRPEVDAYVLHLLAHRTFHKSDFIETADGHVRLMPSLTHELAETMPKWATLIAPVAERVAHTLGQEMMNKYVPATPLTRRTQRSAQAMIKARKAGFGAAAPSTRSKQRPTGRAFGPLWSCPECGSPVTNPRRIRCDSCVDTDPGQTPEVRGRRGAAIAARKRDLQRRVDAGLAESWDLEWYRREVLPRLAELTLRDIMEATGYSKGHASNIRSGRYTPNVSTWRSLARVVHAPPFVDPR